MLLGFLLLVLVTDVLDKKIEEYRYTFTINPLPFLFMPSIFGSRPTIFALVPGINLEIRIKEKLSLNFELNNAWLIFPAEIEIGIREYLGDKVFEGFYLYQGLAGLNLENISKDIEQERALEPSLILTAGYKFIFRNGFTVDPFAGIRIFILEAFPFPAVGLYLGYSW
jgi:hypothetical protein